MPLKSGCAEAGAGAGAGADADSATGDCSSAIASTCCLFGLTGLATVAGYGSGAAMGSAKRPEGGDADLGLPSCPSLGPDGVASSTTNSLVITRLGSLCSCCLAVELNPDACIAWGLSRMASASGDLWAQQQNIAGTAAGQGP
eukprot:CAMPEP_0170583600 /NCGR_PEP_ID=MMETSP0224-20130122/8223_1 /TAXON_ID=285029 /ORGANISM="Togula jolla, Strain CCCM 725" /LENGTH=142 /DNA_ID=CAMNT_0010906941 /DNA_START=464 /DNA_END=892 /DNA_ORIENTATION=-